VEGKIQLRRYQRKIGRKSHAQNMGQERSSHSGTGE